MRAIQYQAYGAYQESWFIRVGCDASFGSLSLPLLLKLENVLVLLRGKELNAI